MPTQPPTESKVLFRSTSVLVGLFRCLPSSPLWREELPVILGPLVVFPWRGVMITQGGRDAIVANPNSVVFHNDNHPYRREMINPDGEESLFIYVEPSSLLPMLEEFDPSVVERPKQPFVNSHGPTESQDFLTQHRLARHLVARRDLDPVLVEERLLALVQRVLRNSFQVRGVRPARRRRDSTRRVHRDAAKEIQRYLTHRFHERVTLAELARHVHMSEYYVCRVFRQQTNSSIHQYLLSLRLRSALRPLGWKSDSLATIATRHGFSSHAHFTRYFTREFGVPPSTVRRFMHLVPERRSQIEELIGGTPN